MKRFISILIVTAMLTFALVGCTDTTDNGVTPSSSSSSSSAQASAVDIDLTVLSSTMVYSEVYNMMTDPESYIGKTIKAKGPFSYYYAEEAQKYYFAVIIADATACCSQGLEFVLEGDYTYPDDYPEVGEEITIEGVFNTYYEGTYLYCQLENATMNR